MTNKIQPPATTKKIDTTKLNAQQDEFARLKAMDVPHAEAIRQAYPTSKYNDASARVRASQLLSNEVVAARVEEYKRIIREQAITAKGFTFEQSTTILLELIQKTQQEVDELGGLTKWRADIIISATQELNRMYGFNTGERGTGEAKQSVIFLNADNLKD